MQKAGGIIALVAGIFGVLAALFTLFFGGLSGAFGGGEDAQTIIGLGWGGVLFSFAVIVLGAVSIGAKGKVPGIILIACAVGGAFLGGGLVAIFMVLALLGGIVATVGAVKAGSEVAA